MSNITAGSYSRMAAIESTLLQAFTPYIIIISLVGIAGNVLTIIMLSKRTLTKNFNNCTLIALALADLLFNFALMSRCITDLKQSRSVQFCRVLSFLSHLAELLSACFTAHFTVQRFIAVRFPLSVLVEKKVHLLHYFIVTLFILSGIAYCTVLVIKATSYEGCHEELELIWFITDALLSFVIPFTIIAILNLLIVCHLRTTSRNHQRLLFKKRSTKEMLPLTPRKKGSISYDSNSAAKISENPSTRNTKSSIYQFPTNSEINDQFLSADISHCRMSSIRSTTRSHDQSHRVTRMLILVSTCFLLLNAPAHILSIGLKFYATFPPNNMSPQISTNFSNTSDIITTTTTTTISENLSLMFTTTAATLKKKKINLRLIFYVLLIVVNHIAYLSYSINFFLYSFCGMKFRRELTRLLTRYGKYRKQMQTSRILIAQNSC